MALSCNIDAKGKLARLIWGLALVVIAVLLAIFWAWPGESAVAWVVSAAVLLAGAFAVFEARAGWCVMRAMGFKTPM